jgi:hypothetical protein
MFSILVNRTVETMATSLVLCKATEFAMQLNTPYISNEARFWAAHNMHPFISAPGLAPLHFPLMGTEYGYGGCFAAAAVHRDDVALLVLGCITTAQVGTFTCNKASHPQEIVRSKHTLADLHSHFAGCKDSQIRVVVGAATLPFPEAIQHLWSSPMELLDSTKAALQRLGIPLCWLANLRHAGQQGAVNCDDDCLHALIPVHVAVLYQLTMFASNDYVSFGIVM